MNTEKNKLVEIWGEKIGYLSSYLLFTTGLYLFLSFFKKIPTNYSYFHLVGLIKVFTITNKPF